MPEDLYRYFTPEARELVEGLTQGALHVERVGTLTPEQRKHLLRLAHTLKGAARVVKEAAIADAAHAIEDLISSAPDAMGPALASRFLALLDGITSALPKEDAGPAVSEKPQGTQADDPSRAVRVDLSEIDGALEQASHIGGRLAEVVRELENLRDDLPPASRHVTTAIEGLSNDLGQLRSHLYQMRLAPASSVFLPLERAVRDAAQASGVRARFEAAGGEHRMDADVLASLRDALIQLVRNAIAHGIEAPAARAAAGKPGEGIVRLSVERRGADMAFTLSDDGRGLDVNALRQAAMKAGLLRNAPGGEVSERELIGLLLEGGLTSRGSVSQISGRGVGLDLVRAVLARLGGRLTLENASGTGVTIVMILPVSLRSLTYLRLETAQGSALIPLDAVHGTARVTPAEMVDVGGRPHLVVDHRPVPVIGLETILTGAQQLLLRSTDRVAVLTSDGEHDAAISAERFGEAGSTIAQALPPRSAASTAIRGIAVDDAAQIVPVLEPGAVIALARSMGLAVARPERRVPRLLVVDDSITTRMLEQSILESAGFEVHTAASAEEALTRIASTSYDLFLVDVEMPGMNGFQFVAATRADPGTAATPAMLVTSRASEDDRRRGLEAGARAYVVKGEFDQDIFLNTVRGLVA